MLKLSVLIGFLFILVGCFPGSGEWDAGPIRTLGVDENTLLKDAFSIDAGARDLTLFLKGGKDYSLYAQWYSDDALFDLESPPPTFNTTNEDTIRSSITTHKPKWWGIDTYDHVYQVQFYHCYIGVTQLENGSFRYEAVRYLDMPHSVYTYFE